MESKEALQRIKDDFEIKYDNLKNEKDRQNIIGLCEVIEKDLELLEILKKKEVAIDELKNCIKHDSKDRLALEEYNDFAGDENSLTQEEFKIIKEYLK